MSRILSENAQRRTMGEIEFHVSVNADADVVIPEWLRAKMGLIEIEVENDDAEDEPCHCQAEKKVCGNASGDHREVIEAIRKLEALAKDYGLIANVTLDVDR